jgi:hypothetical protein
MGRRATECQRLLRRLSKAAIGYFLFYITWLYDQNLVIKPYPAVRNGVKCCIVGSHVPSQNGDSSSIEEREHGCSRPARLSGLVSFHYSNLEQGAGIHS